MKKQEKWVLIGATVFFVIILSLFFSSFSNCQTIVMDTTYLDVGDSTYQLLVLHHKPDSVDSNHIMEFGYERYGLGWKARLESDSMVFIYTEDPLFRFDVNRDGQVNLGDVVAMIRKVFVR